MSIKTVVKVWTANELTDKIGKDITNDPGTSAITYEK